MVHSGVFLLTIHGVCGVHHVCVRGGATLVQLVKRFIQQVLLLSSRKVVHVGVGSNRPSIAVIPEVTGCKEERPSSKAKLLNRKGGMGMETPDGLGLVFDRDFCRKKDDSVVLVAIHSKLSLARERQIADLRVV